MRHIIEINLSNIPTPQSTLNTDMNMDDHVLRSWKGLVPSEIDKYLKIRFTTEDEAKAFVAKFPKYCKVSYYKDYERHNGETLDLGFSIALDISVYIDDRTGAANETAEKRRSKILQVLETLVAKDS